MTENWRVKAKVMLSEGLGVEDISIRLSVPVNDVRCLVKAMRDNGMMEAIYAR